LLFSDVSFRASSGEHVGLVGSNGVGKSTLFRVLTGELQADEGDVSVGVVVGYMAQDVGAADDSRSVRELLLSLAPLAVRRAGERVLRSERDILGAKHGVVGRCAWNTAVAAWRSPWCSPLKLRQRSGATKPITRTRRNALHLPHYGKNADGPSRGVRPALRIAAR
jgi:energy-coupling factor transporter ATP-binding protein EcfA2